MAGVSLLAGAVLQGIGTRRTEVADASVSAEPEAAGAGALRHPGRQVGGVGHPQLVAGRRGQRGRHRVPGRVERPGAQRRGQGRRRRRSRARPGAPRGHRASAGPSRSSRSTTLSALRATRASKPAAPSPRSVTPSRYSRTASTSSAALGRPKGGRGPTAGSGSGRAAGGVTPRRTKRSHSLSQTRRPMAASSTERVSPLRWVAACSAQMAAHLTVA